MMSEAPLISVIIPSYNSATYIGAAIASVLAQSYEHLEVLVIDDGSTDATETIVEPFRDRVRYIRQANGGVSQARNRGIREARGEWIAFLDADDWWLPDRVARQWERLRAEPDVHLAHTNVYVRYEPQGREVLDLRNHGRYSGWCYAQAFWGNAIITSSVLVSKASLDAVGTFDENTRYAEDYDLWIRLARRYRFAYIDEPLVVYREHQANASRLGHAMFEGEYYVLAKALAMDPELGGLLGARKVRERLYQVAFGAAYAKVEWGDVRAARRYFARAWKHAPWRLGVGGMWLSTFLPSSLRHKLRVIKRAIRRSLT